MIQKVQGEQPFQILASSFSIGPSSEGYTLQISADGDNYSNLFTVPANTTRMVTGVANGSFYRLSGNNSEVAINWRTQCKDGGGGGSYILPVASEDTLGGIKVGDGLSIDSEGVLSSEGGIDSGAVETQILSHNYVTSAEVETQISEKNYTTSAAVETQITNKNYITSAQGATLYASQDDMDFISGRTQTNERVLAEAVADIAETDAKFSAYTPTTGFSTINGSAITEGNNIVIESNSGYTLPPATTANLGGVIVGDYLQVDNDGRVSVSPEDMRGNEVYFDSDRVKMTDRTNGDWTSFEDNMCGMAKVPLGYARTEVVISGMEYGTFLWVNSDTEHFNNCSVDYLEGEGTPYVSLYDGTDDYILDMETEGTSAITCSIGVGNPDDYILYFEQTNEYKDIEGSTELVAIFTMKVYDAIQDRFLMITDGSISNLDEVSAGAYEDKLEWCEVVFAQAKKRYDEEIGDVGKWVKYYNQDNIKEVIADKVSSDTVAKIWRGTLAEYTAITPKDPSTLYIIIPNSGE